MTCAQGLLRLLWGGPKLECYGTERHTLLIFITQAGIITYDFFYPDLSFKYSSFFVLASFDNLPTYAAHPTRYGCDLVLGVLSPPLGMAWGGGGWSYESSFHNEFHRIGST